MVLLIQGCDSAPLKPKERTLDPHLSVSQRVFFAPFDKVWQAAHAAIQYTTASENQDAGIIETDYIKASDGFQGIEGDAPRPQGLRYKLIFNFIRGRTDNRESTRITIEKKMEVLKDFFSDPIPYPSDGLEERTIFYRIERELIISETLRGREHK